MTNIIIVYDGLGPCCSGDPINLLPQAARCKSPQDCLLTAREGGMSPLQSRTQYLAANEFGNEFLQNITVGRGEREDVVILVMPGASIDMKFDIKLQGEGAEANIYGAYVCGGEERVKIAVDMHHEVAHCNSRQLFKGIAGGVSKVDFYGKIIVAKDAQRTEAYQENHNILLSDGAKVDTKPQLEIYADDVKCSHGATIGRLNEDEQFYMRSRGITLEDAKVLQMISFIAPVLENIPDEAEREKVAAELEAGIRSLI